MSWASMVEKPPTSGVPVPGAYTGSSPSTSKLTYVGPSPAIVRASSMTERHPRSNSSSM